MGEECDMGEEKEDDEGTKLIKVWKNGGEGLFNCDGEGGKKGEGDDNRTDKE
jgi:hypothetical protein